MPAPTHRQRLGRTKQWRAIELSSPRERSSDGSLASLVALSILAVVVVLALLV